MRVFCLTMLFPTETFMGAEVRALREAGVDVSVHCLLKAPGNYCKLLNEWGLGGLKVSYASFRGPVKALKLFIMRPVLTCSFIAWIIQNTWFKPVHLLKCLWLAPRSLEIFDDIEQMRPDVVHLLWGHYPALVGELVQRECPDIVFSHFLGAYDLWHRKNKCSAMVASSADVVWTHTAYNIPEIEALGVSCKKIELNHRGIDLGKVVSASEGKIRHRMITAGRLIKMKGQDGVLKAFRKVWEQHPDASLVILGDGPERQNLENLSSSLGLEDSVIFMGNIGHASVYQEMSRSEVFIFMSLSERLPNVLKEAMACRCLCVTTETPGISELIEHGVSGYVLPWDIDAVARQVNEIFALTRPPQGILDAAYEHVRTEFNVHKSALNYVNKWLELATHKAH